MTEATADEKNLETRASELAAERDRLEGRRADLAEELEEAKTAVQEARAAHREGDTSAKELAGVQARASALEASLEEIEGELASVRSELRSVRERLRDREELEELAALALEAEQLWEEWDAKRRELADAVSRLAEEIVDRELRLAEIAEEVKGEDDLARRLRASDRDASLAPLGGYREPDGTLRRLWRGRNGMEVRVPFVAGAPERSDLGEVDDLVESIIEREREDR